ncbi:DUF7405 family protein [Halomarina ordinaria]|uniref:Tat pathway signal protein n=1 Tax=Halomarina ordinaria TaxID=3033939 RepID=A0ABD5U993_9EURY|nr:Tat pathway signal protein [Halomarina sp. PSRA2]
MRPDPSLDRREFLKAAVALGGVSALSACLDRFEDDPEPVPTGADPDSLPARQFAWNDRLPTDDAGNTVLPRHQTLWYLTLDGDGPPDAGERETVAAALATLDRAYERSNEGLLSLVAYSPAYFERFDDPLPESVDLPRPRALSTFEDPALDEQDALLHLASDRPDVLLEAEEALKGEVDEANGETVEAALTDVFTLDDRRTGFVGDGMPREAAAETQLSGIPEGNPIPEESPLFMGFKAGLKRNQASEDAVTIPEGPFADGTTLHVSNIRQRLDDWYGEQDHDQRVMEMFSPTHVTEDLVPEGSVGTELGDFSGVTREIIDRIEDDALEFGRVGHAQKAARANRDAGGDALLLRRHFESTDDDAASLHFPSLQRGISQFEAVREAMNGADLTQVTPAIRQRVNNGILEYIFTDHRGNFLVPPRDRRALPPAAPDA